MLSAHAALGHEWDVVVIAGLQEGLWPNTIPRGGVLGTQRLLDVLDGVDQNASMRAPLLAEERRLLVAAMGRARKRLLVTAIDGEANGNDEASMPSPFFAEIAQWATGGFADAAAGRDGAAGAVDRRGGGPAARCGVRTAGRGQRCDTCLRGNAIGPAGRSRGARCRPGRLVWHDAGQHHRADVE